MGLATSSSKVVVFRQRLDGLFGVCREVAAQQGAILQPGSVMQEMFSLQMSTGGRVELPTARIINGTSD